MPKREMLCREVCVCVCEREACVARGGLSSLGKPGARSVLLLLLLLLLPGSRVGFVSPLSWFSLLALFFALLCLLVFLFFGA